MKKAMYQHGHQLFADGVAREVFEGRDGRQYVLDDADRRAYGRWLAPADEPYITGAEGPGDDR